MNEEKWDSLLHIRTTGRDDSHSDQYRYPYEPTPYSVLERLANPEKEYTSGLRMRKGKSGILPVVADQMQIHRN